MKASKEGTDLIAKYGTADIAAAEATVNAALTVAIPQNQFDALVSVVASGMPLEPRAIRWLNMGDAPPAMAVLNEVVMAGNRYTDEQINRRAAEVALFKRGL